MSVLRLPPRQWSGVQTIREVNVVCRGRCCEAADAVEIEVVVVVELLPPVLWLDAYTEAELVGGGCGAET